MAWTYSKKKKEDDFWSTWVDKVQESLTAADSPRVCPLRHLESPKSGSSHRDVLNTKEHGTFGRSGTVQDCAGSECRTPSVVGGPELNQNSGQQQGIVAGRLGSRDSAT